LNVFPISPIYATFPGYVIRLDLITLIILYEESNYEAPRYAVCFIPL
jgi:hypothetical protein